MPSAFEKLVLSNAPATPKLPLLHSMSAYTADEILKAPTPTLKPTDCDVFKEPLLYLFYGRPSYRVADQEKDRGDDFYAPVCFVLAPGAAVKVKRLFPFDTGAFARYKSFFHHRMTQDDFALAPDPDTPGRHVSAFFKTNRSYFLGKATPGLTFPGAAWTAQAYYNLITATGAQNFDGRCSSVEIQADHDVTLAGQTLAVVLPTSMTDDETTRNILVPMKAQLLVYPIVHLSRPSDYHGEVRACVMNYLRGEGFL